MEFTMFRFSTRNRKTLLKAREGETIIISKLCRRAFTSNYMVLCFVTLFCFEIHNYLSIPLHHNVLALQSFFSFIVSPEKATYRYYFGRRRLRRPRLCQRPRRPAFLVPSITLSS